MLERHEVARGVGAGCGKIGGCGIVVLRLRVLTPWHLLLVLLPQVRESPPAFPVRSHHQPPADCHWQLALRTARKPRCCLGFRPSRQYIASLGGQVREAEPQGIDRCVSAVSTAALRKSPSLRSAAAYRACRTLRRLHRLPDTRLVTGHFRPTLA